MKRWLRAGTVAGLALLFGATPAWARIEVATFIAKADALKTKGPFALLSGDLKLLKAEAAEASRLFRIDKAARIKAGNPISCPPPGSKLGAMEFVDELRSIPVAQQSMQLKDGMAWVSRRRYPCV